MGIKTGGYRPIVIALGLVLFLAGCGFAGTGDLIRGVISVQGAKVADTSLANSVWGVCKGTSMGAVMRRFGNSAEAMKSYVDFCFPQQHTPFGSRIEALNDAVDEVFPNPGPTEVIPPEIEPFPTEE